MNRLKNILFFLLLASIAAFSITYKSTDFNGTNEFIAEEKKRPKGQIEPLPSIDTPPLAVVNFVRDPFIAKFKQIKDFSNFDFASAYIRVIDQSERGVLIVLPDNAAYWVKKEDKLWGGEIVIKEINRSGVTLMYKGENHRISLL